MVVVRTSAVLICPWTCNTVILYENQCTILDVQRQFCETTKKNHLSMKSLIMKMHYFVVSLGRQKSRCRLFCYHFKDFYGIYKVEVMDIYVVFIILCSSYHLRLRSNVKHLKRTFLVINSTLF